MTTFAAIRSYLQNRSRDQQLAPLLLPESRVIISRGGFSMLRGWTAKVCVLAVGCSMAYGQGAKTASSKAAGTFSTTSRNVVLDVIVTDSAGKPIHGLTAHDFTVLENGTPQPVKGFEEHRPDAPSSKPTIPVQLPADTYTNYVSSTEPGAVNVILFDSLNTDRPALVS